MSHSDEVDVEVNVSRELHRCLTSLKYVQERQTRHFETPNQSDVREDSQRCINLAVLWLGVSETPCLASLKSNFQLLENVGTTQNQCKKQ